MRQAPATHCERVLERQVAMDLARIETDNYVSAEMAFSCEYRPRVRRSPMSLRLNATQAMRDKVDPSGGQEW